MVIMIFDSPDQMALAVADLICDEADRGARPARWSHTVAFVW